MKTPFAISLNNQPLESLNKDYGSDHWRESSLMSEMRTAKAWGLTPAMWYDEPTWSREVMVAYENVDSDIAAVIRQREKIKAKRKKK